MRKVEARLWDRMRPRLVAERIFAERIENVVGEGTPDVHTAFNGHAAWVELKAVEAWPFKLTTPVMGSRTHVRKEQRAWHVRYALSGGTSYVLLGVGSLHVFLIEGAYAPDCGQWTQNELVARSAASGWADVMATLKGER